MELDAAAKEGRFENEGWRIRKDGSRFWANVITMALKDDRGLARDTSYWNQVVRWHAGNPKFQAEAAAIGQNRAGGAGRAPPLG